MTGMAKYRAIMDSLITDILEMAPLSKMPSRQELCQKFQCTRMTIDRAIVELIKQGYLSARQGSGTYVAETKKNKAVSNKTWALIVPNIIFYPCSNILRGVGDIAQKNKIGVQVYNTDHDVAKQDEIIKQLVRLKIDGLIILPAITAESQYETFHYLATHNIPFIFCIRGVEGVPNIPLVGISNFYGGYIAVKYLLTRGYKKPAFISNIVYRISKERMEGYMAAICEHGMENKTEYIIDHCSVNNPEEPLGYNEVTAMLKLPEPPDSIFCSGEATINAVYKAVQDMGLDIPGDIGVIGHDNSPICLQKTPMVTAVNLDGYEVGRRAACLLLNLMKGEVISDINLQILHPEIVERQSCIGPQKKEK
jgi:DNA-binding LacI/PurR family transcriptional regulator